MYGQKRWFWPTVLIYTLGQQKKNDVKILITRLKSFIFLYKSVEIVF